MKPTCGRIRSPFRDNAMWVVSILISRWNYRWFRVFDVQFNVWISRTLAWLPSSNLDLRRAHTYILCSWIVLYANSVCCYFWSLYMITQPKIDSFSSELVVRTRWDILNLRQLQHNKPTFQCRQTAERTSSRPWLGRAFIYTTGEQNKKVFVLVQWWFGSMIAFNKRPQQITSRWSRKLLGTETSTLWWISTTRDLLQAKRLAGQAWHLPTFAVWLQSLPAHKLCPLTWTASW